MLLQEIKTIHKEFLKEGGASGHLAHLYDNPTLTFGEIKEVIQLAATGHLEQVTEKLDGANLVFTWNDGLRVARNAGDIRGGGMDAQDLARRFANRGNVEEAFTSAFKVLKQALGSLNKKTRDIIFEGGHVWFSMEIIYSGLSTTINYDHNNIVFHGYPVFRRDDDGSVEEVHDQTGIEFLKSEINNMQAAVAERNWHVRGPTLVRLKKISDGSIVNTTISQIDEAMAEAGVSDSNTISDYIFNMARDRLDELDLGPQVLDSAAARLAGRRDAPTLTQLKKLVPASKIQELRKVIKADQALRAFWIAPIEMAIHDFSIEVLRGLKSSLIADSDAEVRRLRTQVNNAIKKIQSSGNLKAMEVLKKQMGKLKSVENIASPMEGIVFVYKNQAYKFTGAFAPAHQLISLFSFGHMSEGFKLIIEGGHAFTDVGPISLDTLKTTWPYIEDDLGLLGLKDVNPIGTTWKKDPMSDIDLVAVFDGQRDELYSRAIDMFGEKNVRKVGANIVSLSYPIYNADSVPQDEHVQVDIMLGKPSYITWSRYGPSPIKGHKAYSRLKGVMRNKLLNVITRDIADYTFPGEQHEFERVRYAIDFDHGLFIIKQSRLGTVNKRTGVPRVLKTWRTVERKYVTDDPEKIVSIIFGKGIHASDIHSVEDIVHAIKNSPKLAHDLNKIMHTFVSEIERTVVKNPAILGSDPDAAMTYIKSLEMLN